MNKEKTKDQIQKYTRGFAEAISWFLYTNAPVFSETLKERILDNMERMKETNEFVDLFRYGRGYAQGFLEGLIKIYEMNMHLFNHELDAHIISNIKLINENAGRAVSALR